MLEDAGLVTGNKRVQAFAWDGMPGHLIIETRELPPLLENRSKRTTDPVIDTPGPLDPSDSV